MVGGGVATLGLVGGQELDEALGCSRIFAGAGDACARAEEVQVTSGTGNKDADASLSLGRDVFPDFLHGIAEGCIPFPGLIECSKRSPCYVPQFSAKLLYGS